MQDRNIHKALQTLSDRQSTLKKKDETFKNIQSLEGHNYAVLCVAVLPNGNIISGSADKTLKVWETPFLSLSIAEMKKKCQCFSASLQNENQLLFLIARCDQ